MLKVVVSYSGDVEEVTVESGDPALAQAAVDAVKKWKYKPYQAEGSPAEMETDSLRGMAQEAVSGVVQECRESKLLMPTKKRFFKLF